jgi:regulator of sigma E protease
VAEVENALATLADWGAIATADHDEGTYEALLDESLAEDPDALLTQARNVTYRGLPTWKRIAVLSAGVAVNLLTAILVFTFVISVFGYYQPSLKLDSVVAGGAAQTAGIRAGDRIQSVDGETPRDWTGFTNIIASHKPGDRLTVTFVRDGEEHTATVVLGAREDGTAIMGVQAQIERVRPGVIGALVDSLRWTGMVFQAVADLFRPSTFRQTLGHAMSVVGISVEVAKVVKTGPLDYAWLVAFLSLSLGVMNLLPIPPLDGGKVAIEIVEKAIGRPLSRKLAYSLSAVGAILLFTLVGYLIYADIMRLAGHAVAG